MSSWQEIVLHLRAWYSRKLGFYSSHRYWKMESYLPWWLHPWIPLCTEKKRVEFTKDDKSSNIHHYWQMSQSMWKNYRIINDSFYLRADSSPNTCRICDPWKVKQFIFLTASFSVKCEQWCLGNSLFWEFIYRKLI